MAGHEPADRQVTPWAEIRRGGPDYDETESLEVLLAGVVEGVRAEIPVIGAVVLTDKTTGDEEQVGHPHDLPELADEVGIALGGRQPRTHNPQDPQPRLTDGA